MNGGALRFLPAAAWMAVIFALSQRSSVPTLGVGRGLVSSAGHFVFYGVLATLLWRGLPPRRFSGRVRLGAAFVITVLFGASDEFHQSFVPGREVSAVDLAVDASGAAVALGLVARGARRGRAAEQLRSSGVAPADAQEALGATEAAGAPSPRARGR